MFGRRKDDEDPFAALKEGGTYQSAPVITPEPPVTPTASGTPAPPPDQTSSVTQMSPVTPASQTRGGRRASPVRLGSGFGRGSGIGLIWRLAVFAFVAVIGITTALTVSHSVHSVKIPSFTFNTGGVTTSNTGGSSAGSGTPAPRPVSYLTPHGLRVGLAHVARLTHGAKLTLLRVDARTLSVYATRSNGTTSQVYFSPAVTLVSPAPAPGEHPLPASAIRPNVVGALVTQMHRRFHVPASRIDYMVVSTPSGQPPEWLVFVKNASHQGYIAPLDGGTLRPI